MAGDRNDSGRPNAGRRRTRGLSGLAASLMALALVAPAAAQAALPNPGAWESTSYAWDFAFTVSSSRTALSGFDPPRSYWSCNGQYGIWTDLSPISASISGAGTFTNSVSGPVSGLDRTITATLSGQFTAPDRASGTLSESLSGCTPQVHSWSAFGPATVYPSKPNKKKQKAKKKKRKKKKGKRKGGGGGDGDSGDICVPIQLPDGWIICV